MTRKFALALLCTVPLMLGACNRKPTGQVAATVNGKEITVQEINTELQSAQIPQGADKQTVQRALLQRVIDRKLLIGAAEDKGLDKNPEYMAEKRRMDELLLAQSFAKQQLTAVPVPTAAEVDKYIADHPNVYSHREQLSLDQVRFPAPKNPDVLKPLAADHTLDAVAARLKSLGIAYQRGPSGLDTGTVPPNILDQINKLPPSEPFVIPQPGLVTVNTIVSRKAIEGDPAVIRQAATRNWRQQKFADVIQSKLTSLKSGAKIRYQPGFGPAPAGGAPAKQ